MKIDWLSFAIVAGTTLLSSLVLVGLFSLGIRLLAVAADPTAARRPAAHISARVCFGLCGLVVLYGVYLIIPVLH